VDAFQDAALRHFNALQNVHGVGPEAAAALALRLAASASLADDNFPATVVRLTDAHAVAWRAAHTGRAGGGGGEEAEATRAPLLTAISRLLSVDTLAVSFLSERPEQQRGDGESPLSLPEQAVLRLSLDLEHGKVAFKGLQAVAHVDAQVASRVSRAIDACLLRLHDLASAKEDKPHSLTSYCVVLRVGLLLLFCWDGFADPSAYDQLHRLLSALAALSDSVARVGALMMSQLPGEMVVTLLEKLHSHFLTCFYQHLGGSDVALRRWLAPCAAIIAWLHAANVEAGGRLVPWDAFHNDALNSPDWVSPPPGHHAHSHLSDDYTAWVNMHQRSGDAPLTVAASRRQSCRAAAGGGRSGGSDGGGVSFCTYPFLYRPETKAEILRLECQRRKTMEFNAGVLRTFLDSQAVPYCILRVRRDNIVSDAAREIHRRRADLHKPLKVVFVGEEGIDEGGPTREFFTLVTRAIFNPDYGMFTPLDDDTRVPQQEQAGARLLWFAPGGCDAVGADEYELVGTVLGLALYNSTLLELAFPRVVYKLLQGGVPAFDDLKDASPRLHSSLCDMLRHPPDAVEADFGLNFEVSYSVMGEVRTAELQPDGASTAVTGTNVREFVALYADWFLSRSVAPECAAFRRGFARLCDGPASRLFTPSELEQMLCGTEDLDFEALERNTEYDGGFSARSPACRSFWRVAQAMNASQKKRLLAFVTGSDRVPIGGLSALPFKLMRNGDGDERLPTAQTCFHVLLLPQYSNEEVLKDRLLLALDNAEGFGLR